MIDPSLDDKSTWGKGPWHGEPDRVEWRHAGLPCLAIRNHHGAWCGYAAVPPRHPLHGKDYDTPDVRVHGGVTYASLCADGICHVAKPGEPEDVWWFGFDCMHSGDFAPAMHARTRRLGGPFRDEAYDHEAAVAALASETVRRDVYRTLDYVLAETNQLAEWLAAARGGKNSEEE